MSQPEKIKKQSTGICFIGKRSHSILLSSLTLCTFSPSFTDSGEGNENTGYFLDIFLLNKYFVRLNQIKPNTFCH